MGKKGEERRVTQGGLTWEALLQCGRRKPSLPKTRPPSDARARDARFASTLRARAVAGAAGAAWRGVSRHPDAVTANLVWLVGPNSAGIAIWFGYICVLVKK